LVARGISKIIDFLSIAAHPRAISQTYDADVFNTANAFAGLAN